MQFPAFSKGFWTSEKFSTFTSPNTPNRHNSRHLQIHKPSSVLAGFSYSCCTFDALALGSCCCGGRGCPSQSQLSPTER